MTEETESTGALLGDEALLRRVLEREPSLVSRIVSHAGFLEALFSRPEAWRGLLRAPLIADDYQLEQLLVSIGGDGASLRAQPSGKAARLLHVLQDAEAMEKLFREKPELAEAVAANPAFVEQVKVRKPHFYRALLEKAEERFSKDAGLMEEIRAEQESLEVFTNEGGKKERERERRRRLGEELLEAAKDGRNDAMRALLKRGGNANFQDSKGWTALMHMAESGYSDDVQALLKGGADPNLQNNNEWTALMLAAYADHPEVVRALLKGGADPNLQDRMGMTALMHATRFSHTDTVQALLEGGADPNLLNRVGCKARNLADTYTIAEMLAEAERQSGGRDSPGQERGW